MSFYLMHRGWMDNPIFTNEPFTEREAWEWLISEASYEPHKMRYKSEMIYVGRGEVPTSYRKLVAKWQWGIHRIRRFLDLLSTEAMITLKTATGFLIVTICNYERYQKPLTNTATQAATVAATLTATQAATNIKKGKEGERRGNKKTPGRAAPEYGVEFLKFWKIYPRRDGSKAEAAKSYQHAITEGINHARLAANARAYADYAQRNGVEQSKICHAATWLNQRRWESEYHPSAAVSTAKPGWKSEGERLAAKYHAQAQSAGQGPVEPMPGPGVCPTEAIRQDGGGTGNASGGLLLGTSSLRN